MLDELRVRIDSERTVTLYWPDAISLERHFEVMALTAAVRQSKWAFLWEDVVPGYSALSIHFDPWTVRKYRPTAVSPTAFVAEVLQTAGGGNNAVSSAELAAQWRQKAPELEVPARYGGGYGPDLTAAADRLGISEDALIAQHTGTDYCVFMLGFLPGFPYLGPLPETLALPRHPTPRLRVPAGSVAIAGRQTGIYPQSSPGGWHLIGQTDLILFDPGRKRPALFEPGMKIRFKAC